MTATIQDKYAELGTEVPVSQIDKELHKLWEQDEARSNASLMNLVVYTETRGGLLENSRIINDLTRENACRAILVEIDREPDPSIRAWITAHCHLSHGAKSVCCEQISFLLTGRVPGRFRNTVFSHLNSDLPLIFWWQGELSDVFTERLASVMNRLIVDSSGWDDVHGGFERINEAVEGNSSLVVQDLAWTRCWQVRAGIAGLFDDSAAKKILRELDTVAIRHAAEDRNTALQVLAWLSVQAGWQITGDMLFTTTEGREISVELVSEKGGPSLRSVELCSASATVRVVHQKDSPYLLREIEMGEYHVSSLAPADPQSSEKLVAEQLARGGKNSLFLKILPTFLQLVGRKCPTCGSSLDSR